MERLDKGNQAPAENSRREMLVRMGTGLAALTVESAWGQISPGEAHSRGVPLRHFTAAEARAFEAWGDVLLPGAAEAGITHFIDDQLSRDNPMFLLKYLDYTGPYSDFYKNSLQSLDHISRARFQEPFFRLSADRKNALAREISAKNPPEWTGPPAPLFYFATRNDAVDVFYGTVQGFAKLGIPYMAHILPPQPW